MKSLSVAEDIVPIGEFKAKAARLLARLNADKHPLVVTQNGKPVAVLLAPAEFDRLREREAFLESVAAGIADVETGRIHTTAAVRQRVKQARAKQKTR